MRRVFLAIAISLLSLTAKADTIILPADNGTFTLATGGWLYFSWDVGVSTTSLPLQMITDAEVSLPTGLNLYDTLILPGLEPATADNLNKYLVIGAYFVFPLPSGGHFVDVEIDARYPQPHSNQVPPSPDLVLTTATDASQTRGLPVPAALWGDLVLLAIIGLVRRRGRRTGVR